MKKSVLLYAGIAVFGMLIAATTLSIDDFFLPGSQIGQSGNLETPDRCDNCHGGYDASVEPAFNWRGSMMAMAARDPLFYACLAVANKDAPGVGDLCLRCHTPDGWLNGRCEPTDGSALNQNDREGVQCDFCHKLVTPLQKDENGEYINPYPGDSGYDTENYSTITFEQDKSYIDKIIPVPGTTANGMYLADDNNAKRGPYTDAEGRHHMVYSPFHKEAALCGTCHDVSNPAFIRQNTADEEYVFIEHLNTGDNTLAELNFDLRHMFPVERTYSEWLASGYSSESGKTCQDCHMKKVNGKGAKMKNAPLRPDLPLHDFTGGNTFTPLMIMEHPVWKDEVNSEALLAGIERARNQLRSAADFELRVDESTNIATVIITNKTGHKLPTGYPEGRRMWINLKVYYNDGNIKEFGAYDENNFEHSISDDTEIYECKPGFSEDWASSIGKPAAPSFNFAINNKIWKDNRIPPAGFSHDLLKEYQSPVVIDGAIDKARYSSNSDSQDFALGTGYIKVEAHLLYQTTSPEYVYFLQQNGGTAGQELYDLWDANGRSIPEVMNSDVWDSNNQAAAPIADFSADPFTGTATLNVQFTDLSTNSPTSWNWDFGDGGTATEQNPEYTFMNPGTYDVSLTVNNDSGSDNTTKTITIDDNTTPGDPTITATFGTWETINGAKGYKKYAVTVTTSPAVAGADVTGYFDGGSSQIRTTGDNGSVVFESQEFKGNVSMCLTISDIIATDYVFEGPVSGCTAKSAQIISENTNSPRINVYPNPFTDKLYFEFSREEDAECIIELFDVSGRKLDVLFNQNIDSGKNYRIEYQSNNNLPSLLFYRVQFDDEVTNGKIIHQ